MSDQPSDTIASLIAGGLGDAPAIGAPARPAMTYAALRALTARTGAALNGLGVGRGDRVAIVLPNGPEMASAFVAISGVATTAPLNPAYRPDEFDFYLGDLGARALVVLDGAPSEARAVAAARGIPIFELLPGSGEAGDFTLRAPAGTTGTPRSGGVSQPDDVALILHTSGTTSRPKIVPLRHSNVTASATNIGATLRLSSDDVCLNIMPLFHIHGLIAAVLSSLAAGGQVVCTQGFNGFKFFGWLDEVRPTWYTAVPTMHQALLPLVPRNRAIVERARLRFVRSSSASLPGPVMMELEAALGVPVIESYGMTEAAHQMASNPLPPRPRYAGSVGVAAGPEIAILDDDGAVLSPGALGEVAIRGRNVTSGYENNPEANAKAFVNGWFRTGDQGVLDDDGYLRLTGRLKEIINRGGEKISPLEVDAILLDHPAVAQAVTFAVPHPKLGEDVAAAVVLATDASCDEPTLRAFAAERLAPFKVPRKIVFLTEIPKGATGKLQRIGLAERLGVGA